MVLQVLPLLMEDSQEIIVPIEPVKVSVLLLLFAQTTAAAESVPGFVGGAIIT